MGSEEKEKPLFTGEFKAGGVVDPPIGELDLAEVVEVVELRRVLLDGDDVVLLGEGVDERVDESWEGVEEVVGVEVSEGVEDEVDSTRDVEESVDDEKVGVEDVEEGTEVSVGEVEVEPTDGDCVLERVGEGVELGVEDGVSEDWALK